MVRAISSAPPTDNSVETSVAASAWPSCGSANSARQWAGERAAPTSSPAAGSSGR